MLLAIDIGNTNLVFALADGRTILHRWRIATNARRTSDEYVVWLQQLFDLHGLSPRDVTSAIVASVVPQAMFEIEQLARDYFAVTPLVIGGPHVDPGLPVTLPNPAEVGADRIVNAVAALAAHAPPLVVVDFGTATTFDAVSAEGAYVGGVICPGINLSMEALFAAAARLPRMAVEPPPPHEPVIGTSTIHAMRSGVFWGYIGLIDGLLARIKSELGGGVRVVATGGLAPLFERHSASIDAVDPDLTIRGLILIHERNTPHSMTPGDELIFLPLGGSGEIGMNVNLYGTHGKWLMVDLGMTFASAELPGIDLVFPDLAFIEDRLRDLVGIVLTHGHEDHIGAIPYLAADLGVPLYATPFTAGLIRQKLIEEGIEREVELNEVRPGSSLKLGPFTVRHVPLAHSIPEGNALLIETPLGRVFHTGDWKLDDEPVIGAPSTAGQLSAIGDAGVLAMVCDSTNVFEAQASGSEQGVRSGLTDVVRAARGRVVVSTFASNAARLHTLGEVARATGRELVIAGRSLERIMKVAQGVGYLTDMPEPLSFEAAKTVAPHKLLIVATGGQGEPRAALSRMASGDHPLSLAEGDTVIYSSRNIPGNELAIGRVQNQLAARGVHVITGRQAHVHVSGHPGRPELEAMYRWIRPQVAVPVHGERRHLEEHARLAGACGVRHAVVPSDGSLIRLAPGAPTVLSHEKVGRLVLDGDVILPADGATMNARRRLMVNGYMAATLVLGPKGKLAADPIIHVQGVPVEEERGAFEADCRRAAREALNGGSRDDARLMEAVRHQLRRVAREWTGKKPVTDVSVIRL